MVTGGVFYGVTAILIAVALFSSSLAVLYYNNYQDQTSSSQRYSTELKAALAKYDSLASSYSTSLKDFKATLGLLSDAAANLNTSSPAYLNASTALASLWKSYRSLASANGVSSPIYSVRMLVNFGNGTRVWYNDTATEPDWNGYVVTLVLLSGRIHATWYPQYGEHFVTGLAGVENNPSTGKAWLLWTWNSTSSWSTAQVGVDQIHVFNGTVFAWSYCSYDPNTYAPLCSKP